MLNLGLYVNTGKSVSGIKPIATVTIAFVKQGLLKADRVDLEDLYVTDIGVPGEVYRKRLDIKWETPLKIKSVNRLEQVFSKDSLHAVRINRSRELNSWTVK